MERCGESVGKVCELPRPKHSAVATDMMLFTHRPSTHALPQSILLVHPFHPRMYLTPPSPQLSV